MIYVHIFIAFFIPGMVGYGGGPASIPLIEHEVVTRYGWMTTSEFSEILAIGNALPGPIATKMAGYIGYEVGGVLGSVVGVFSTVTPSLFLMIVLMKLIFRYKDSPRVKRLSKIVLPAVAVLMGSLTFDFFQTSYFSNGIWATVVIAILSFLLLEKWKVHPAFVIIGGLAAGAISLG
ncbi:chromate transporter [Neobacillus niacini]|uniref:chromate transporter n=1 Tax=Neobacillus niacini TaxID=86668 RepID=UPI00285B4A71|nr:chromate transporter [Neobacillus niacini]MDR7079248.1 chromate transporter [Neobacillus niacini]